jgi:hypothetical protein
MFTPTSFNYLKLLTEMKKNLVIYALPRVGSTYVGGCLHHFKKNHPTNPIHSNTMWLGELFSPQKMKSMLRTSTLDKNNRIVRDRKTFSRINHLPEMYIWGFQNHKYYAKVILEKFMVQNQRPYVLKIRGSQGQHIDNERLKFVIDTKREETSLCFLYRRDVEDMILSWLIAEESQVWNTKFDKSINAKDRFYTGISVDIDKEFLNNILEQIYDHYYNRSKEYPWDLIICYEDLTGDPVVDFQPYFDYPLAEITNSWMPSKLLTKDEKISMIKDYPAFKKLLLQKLNELNMPLFLDRI